MFDGDGDICGDGGCLVYERGSGGGNGYGFDSDSDGGVSDGADSGCLVYEREAIR